jgi:hypothetical protein
MRLDMDRVLHSIKVKVCRGGMSMVSGRHRRGRDRPRREQLFISPGGPLALIVIPSHLHSVNVHSTPPLPHSCFKFSQSPSGLTVSTPAASHSVHCNLILMPRSVTIHNSTAVRCDAHCLFLGVKYRGPQRAGAPPSPRCGSISTRKPIYPDVTRVRSVASLRVSLLKRKPSFFFSPDAVASHQVTASGVRCPFVHSHSSEFLILQASSSSCFMVLLRISIRMATPVV